MNRLYNRWKRIYNQLINKMINMEVNKSKVVEMNPKASGEEVQQDNKISYEELVNVANQLQVQNRKMQQQLYQLMKEHSVIRMNFLFEIVKNSNMFQKDTVEESVKEIEESLFTSYKESGEEISE